jgi:hypothetical protein
MVAFTLSVFALLLFLWVSFGGVLPLKAKGYRFKADFPEAALLAKEADVRLAGVNVGKVKSTELGPGGQTTQAEIELDSRFAPVRVDTRAILRQKRPTSSSRQATPTPRSCRTAARSRARTSTTPSSSTRSSAPSTRARAATSRSGCTTPGSRRRAGSPPISTTR